MNYLLIGSILVLAKVFVLPENNYIDFIANSETCNVKVVLDSLYYARHAKFDRGQKLDSMVSSFRSRVKIVKSISGTDYPYKRKMTEFITNSDESLIIAELYGVPHRYAWTVLFIRNGTVIAGRELINERVNVGSLKFLLSEKFWYLESDSVHIYSARTNTKSISNRRLEPNTKFAHNSMPLNSLEGIWNSILDIKSDLEKKRSSMITECKMQR